MLWVYYTILAVIAWSIASIIDKYALSKLVKKPEIPFIFSTIIGILIAVSIIFIKGVSPMLFKDMILSFTAGIFFFISILFYFKSIQIEEVSRVIPLFYLAPIFVTFFCMDFFE